MLAIFSYLLAETILYHSCRALAGVTVAADSTHVDALLVRGSEHDLPLQLGARVRRGPDWSYSDQDGGGGRLGTVYDVRAWRGDGGNTTTVTAAAVTWDDAGGRANVYRWAAAGRPRDVVVVAAGDDARGAAAGRIARTSAGVNALERAARASGRAAVPVLSALFAELGGRWWHSARGWVVSAEPCGGGWEGVTCRDGAVVALDLSRNNASSPAGRWAPTALARLPHLESLDLSGNPRLGLALDGGAGLCRLRRLRFAALGRTGATGAVPACLGDLARLEVLSLDGNPGVAGPLPPALAAAPLVALHAHGTAIAPPLPPGLVGRAWRSLSLPVGFHEGAEVTAARRLPAATGRR